MPQLDGKIRPGVVERLLHDLTTNKPRATIKSTEELTTMITTYCSNIFDRSRTTAELRLHEDFEASIGYVVRKHLPIPQTPIRCDRRA